MSKLLRGNKISSRCQTYISSAVEIINTAKKMACVTKIVLGVIKPTNSKFNKIKLTDTGTSVQVEIISPRQKQIVYLIGERDLILNTMKKFV